MTWIQFGLLLVCNFLSVILALFFLHVLKERQRLKKVAELIKTMEEEILTEISFRDLVNRINEDDKDNL
jgi:hypothetical protein